MQEVDYRYELFFELSPDLMCIAGFDGYFKKVNPAVADTLGYSFEELYARPINDFVHPDHKDITSRVRGELHQSKPLHHFENKYLTKSGGTVWLSWTTFPVENERLVFAVAKNITHTKSVEADRNRLLARLTQINDDLLQLNYATSDDLKSPVHSLLALFDLLDLSKVNDPDTRQLLEVVQYVGEKLKTKLNTHVDQLTAKSRDNIRAEQVDLKNSLNQVLQSINTLVRSSRATIQADFTKVPTIWFNPQWIKSILLNLITNAIKNARTDALPMIQISGKIAGDWKQLVISDNGAGFDAAKAKKELSEFSSTLQQNPDSKGMGLYLAQSQLTAFGGSMDIESKVGKGTTIVLSFKR